MEVISKNIEKYIDKEVSLKGWVYSVRRSGKIGFLTFRDGFKLLQCIVAKNDVGEQNFDLFKTLTQESSIIIKGKVVKNERAPGGVEVLASSIEPVSYTHLTLPTKA